MGEFDPLERTCVCLHKITQFSRFINKNKEQNRQKAFPNKKFISCLFIGLRSEHIQFLPRGNRLTSDLKEMRVNFEVNLSTHAEHIFKNFANTVRNTKNWSIGIVFQYKFTIKPVIICVLYS